MRNPTNKKNTTFLFFLNLLIFAMIFGSFYFMKGNDQIVQVKTMALNVRQEASVTSPIVSQVHQEDRVTIKDRKNNWYLIQLPDKTTGWVADWLIFDGKSGPYTSLPAVIQRKVDLKEKATSKSKSLATLNKRSVVTVNLELNGWSRVFVDNQVGWIPSEDLKVKMSSLPKWKEGQTLFVATENTMLTSKPEQEGQTPLAYGQKVTYEKKAENSDWIKVKTADGEGGYLQLWNVTEQKINPDEKRPDTPLAEYVVMIDPGHGGNDPGASSNDGKHYEKDMTLATGLAMKQKFEKHGLSVLMTRDKDEFVSLHRIGITSNESHADAFISLHYDSTAHPNEGSGTTTYYRHDNGKPLAKAVNDQIAGILPLPNRGYGKQDYQVLRENNKPAILIELGYMNNDLDAKYARSEKYHQYVSEAVYKGLLEYFQINPA